MQNEWANFPKENVLYQLDVVFKNDNAESEDKQYTIVHYAAFFTMGYCYIISYSFNY